MRTQRRNRTPFYYALYTGKEEVKGADGYYTGDTPPKHGKPILYTYGNVSPATGQAITEQFGTLESYDKVIVTADMDCPIDENTVLWIDNLDITKPYDYIVKRVSKSLNGISIAVAKVNVSADIRS